MIGPRRRAAILNVLRRGTVEGLGAFAVGVERFGAVMEGDFAAVASGRGCFKPSHGQYGAGEDTLHALAAGAAGFAMTKFKCPETATPSSNSIDARSICNPGQ